MSKDYKRPEPTARGGSQLLVGILIGLVLGLGIALGVAWYINKMPNPFTTRTPPTKLEPVKPPPTGSKSADPSARAPDTKPRFDFYKILPGTEEPVGEPSAKGAKRPSTATAGETFFLQAGAFQNAKDAETLRARLALLGIEARVQTATLPDKGVWHRVRVGPYTSVAELDRTRDALKQNGVETTLIKVRD